MPAVSPAKSRRPLKMVEGLGLLLLGVVLAVIWWHLSGPRLEARLIHPGPNDLSVDLASNCTLRGDIDSPSGNVKDQLVIHPNGSGYLRWQQKCDNNDPYTSAAWRWYGAGTFNRAQLDKDVAAFGGADKIPGYLDVLPATPRTTPSGEPDLCSMSEFSEGGITTISVEAHNRTSPELACFNLLQQSGTPHSLSGNFTAAPAAAIMAHDAIAALRRAYQ